MKPTEQQMEKLIIRLKGLGVDRTTAENVVGRVYEKRRMEDLLAWLNQGNPTVNEICEKSREIARMTDSGTEADDGELIMESELEMTIQKLARELIEKKVDRETSVNISLRLETPSKMRQMIDWLQKNNPTVNEICEKSREIAKGNC